MENVSRGILETLNLKSIKIFLKSANSEDMKEWRFPAAVVQVEIVFSFVREFVTAISFVIREQRKYGLLF